MMRRNILLGGVILLLLSCGKNNSSEGISGTIINLDEGTPLYLDYLTPSDIIPLDTAIVGKNGSYFFSSNIEKSGYYRIKIDHQKFLNLVFDEGESPIINGDANNINETYTVENSKESNRLKKFQAAYTFNKITLDSLQSAFQQNRNDRNFVNQLKNSEAASVNKMNNSFMKIINEKAGSLVSMAAVQQLDPKKYIEFYERVDKAMMNKIPNNLWAIDFHKKVDRMGLLSTGKLAPDFTLNDPQGNPISLSSLKGKVVLIDFWASWCRPCRMENPTVVKAYNKFKSKGFDVLSVSLDGVPQQRTPKQDWINAIKADGLIWKNHVSDLKGWNSSVGPLYGLKSIPFTLLIDAEGKILGQNLRGNELETKLLSIFE